LQFTILRFTILLFSGRKITKNICVSVQKQAFTHFFSVKNAFFRDFCLFYEYFLLYLRQIFNVLRNIYLFKLQKL